MHSDPLGWGIECDLVLVEVEVVHLHIVDVVVG